MRRTLPGLVLVGAVAIAAVSLTTPVRATPGSGFTAATLALGRFGDINVFNHLVPPGFWKSRHNHDIWLSWQKTAGQSDVYVQSNVWAPGGKHRMAHTSRPQPDHRHRRGRDRL